MQHLNIQYLTPKKAVSFLKSLFSDDIKIFKHHSYFPKINLLLGHTSSHGLLFQILEIICKLLLMLGVKILSLKIWFDFIDQSEFNLSEPDVDSMEEVE